MAVTTRAKGNLTPTIGVDHDVATDTASGVYELHVDVSQLEAGDTLEAHLLTRCLDEGEGANERSIATIAQSGAASDPLIKSVQVACDQGVKVRIKQTAGVARTVPWALLRMA
jgi:hypothetical protein